MCFVSTATISRLCRKLNYESFSDFKMDVTMNLRYFNHDSMRMQFDHQLPVLPVAGKTTKDLFNDHFENIVQNLRSTYEMIEFDFVKDTFLYISFLNRIIQFVVAWKQIG